MKNAGKACNNRLYRHIRTFEKIVKNYFVIYTTKTYNRLMNTYGEVCTDLEKPTLRSMRDVESAANMFYYTED